MATLGKILQPYVLNLEQRGFHKQAVRDVQDRGPCFADSSGRSIKFDRVKGGDLRCFLEIYPRLSYPGASHPDIQAESRWWRTKHDCSLESAVASAWDYLGECGFSFLEDPLRLTPTQWRERYGLLVRDFRHRDVVVAWPAGWQLNEVVIRGKRCMPEFANVPALQLHQRLRDMRDLVFRRIPLADALELKQAIEMQGFSVVIRDP